MTFDSDAGSHYRLSVLLMSADLTACWRVGDCCWILEQYTSKFVSKSNCFNKGLWNTYLQHIKTPCYMSYFEHEPELRRTFTFIFGSILQLSIVLLVQTLQIGVWAIKSWRFLKGSFNLKPPIVCANLKFQKIVQPSISIKSMSWNMRTYCGCKHNVDLLFPVTLSRASLYI